ncbi:ABC-type transport auxiliary lipoprotein family protein [Roseitranquillus sediminis]|uniref:ABC-type transport auxiliary lipoprotein family protein n=1 Tax=Roseitranquillus sediminis TaxID=2809051 RepID=UPI001D0C1EAD|nr:ABC-type transport auxiliary lipoprotein family protein [Roseitranquillus sediminis]
MERLIRGVVLSLGLCAVGGCAAVSTITAAGERAEVYELTPVAPRSGGSGRAHLLVEVPTTSGALSTDRIVIKPGPLQVEYLPQARWADETGDLIQLLLARSLTNTGRYALVSTGSVRPDPDLYLLVDVQAFQAEVDPATEEVRVVVRMRAALVGDDRRILSSRTFAQSVPAAAPTAAATVPAFDVAMTGVLQAVADWAGGVSS